MVSEEEEKYRQHQAASLTRLAGVAQYCMERANNEGGLLKHREMQLNAALRCIADIKQFLEWYPYLKFEDLPKIEDLARRIGNNIQEARTREGSED